MYVAAVELGNRSYDLIFDSGSSNLWVAASSFECLQPNSSDAAPQSACGFGSLFDGAFADGIIANENFNVSYGFGGSIVGVLGHEDVSLAGITVADQELALATSGTWAGDGVISGVLGLGYPANTNDYIGTDAAHDSNATDVFSTPFLFNAIAQGSIAPLFSIALERGPGGGSGQIALGGLPDVNSTGDFASTPIQARAISAESAATTSFTYYTITPEGYTLNGSLGSCCDANGPGADDLRVSATTRFPVFVDSGSTFIYYPAAIAAQVNALFDPPAVFSAQKGLYEVPCDAVPPDFATVIAGRPFPVDSADLVLPQGFDAFPEPGLCFAGVQPAADKLNTLGDVFLRNVLAVFDVGASEMQFAAHEY